MKTGQLAPHETDLIAWNVASVPVTEQRRRLAARGVSVSIAALYKFRHRKHDGIEKPKARIVAAVVAKAVAGSIREKDERLRRAEVASAKVMEWIETHGLITETQTVGDDDEQITDRRFNRGIVSALVDLNTYAAKELGEMEPERPLAPPERRDDGFSAYILGDSAIRELGQALFSAAAMGARDAGGTGLVRKRAELGSGAAPDDDQRRAPADRIW